MGKTEAACVGEVAMHDLRFCRRPSQCVCVAASAFETVQSHAGVNWLPQRRPNPTWLHGQVSCQPAESLPCGHQPVPMMLHMLVLSLSDAHCMAAHSDPRKILIITIEPVIPSSNRTNTRPRTAMGTLYQARSFFCRTAASRSDAAAAAGGGAVGLRSPGALSFTMGRRVRHAVRNA